MNSQIQQPHSFGRTVWAMACCVCRTLGLLARRRIHLPVTNRGMEIGFADGTSSRVFRETVLDHPQHRDPCVLVVEFELRAVRGRGHALFRRESLLNTVLFAGFPGLISKLWLAHDQRGRYRGLYEWGDPASAETYARTLWGVLALVSVPESIAYRILPGVRRAELFATAEPGAGEWWRPTRTSRAVAATGRVP
ncbi:hypothetical protein BJY24_005633 [Nocardia transvalensis]|uniref:Uncharacterized protein n=1 Tax=Nocardia transvalensis TaxID=37333 RepID=A0A7W9PIE1_9NOCA|nr:hypothetical protein [Nocardia transvalensis]MBB5916721.1 hypothetical protein [Nocardia transvalensis]